MLRIVAMLMICAIHTNNHSGIHPVVAGLPLGGKVGVYACQSLLETAVNLYAMITGYMCVVGSWKLSRYLRLWLQAAFYTVGLFGVVAILCHAFLPEMLPWRMGWILRAFLPVPFAGAYWYFTAYSALFFFIPFINPLLRQWSRARLGALLCLLAGVMVPTSVLAGNHVFASGYNATWLVVMYMAGAFVRLHPVTIPRRWWCVAVGLALAASSLCAVLDGSVVENYTFPPTVLLALCMFHLFEQWHIHSRVLTRMVALLAPYSFGVYLIHEHPAIRLLLTKYLREVYVSVGYSWWVALVCPVVIYLLCSVIDACRAGLFRLFRVNGLADVLEGGLACLWHRVQRCLQKWFGAWFETGR